MAQKRNACNPTTLGSRNRRTAWAQKFETSLTNIAKPRLHKKLAGHGDTCLWSQLIQRMRWEDHLSPGGRGCSEPRSRHCTPAWVTKLECSGMSMAHYSFDPPRHNRPSHLSLPSSYDYRVSLLLPRLKCNSTISAHYNLCLLGSKTGFLYVGQAGLQLPTSHDLPTLASQSAGITGMSHGAHPIELMMTGVGMKIKAIQEQKRGGWLGAVAHICNPNTLGSRGVRDHAGQHGETPCLPKNTKTSQMWRHAPVIPATHEAEAGESLESWRQMLNLDDKRKAPSKKKKKTTQKFIESHRTSGDETTLSVPGLELSLKPMRRLGVVGSRL
ncbi:hypothetical protein AAY473_013527 [Plecturocebus cupreus]